MTKEMMIRAWKDPIFRASLTAEQRAQLPENPAGVSAVELDDSELGAVVGGLGEAETSGPVSHCLSCGWICTYSTECKPICMSEQQ